MYRYAVVKKQGVLRRALEASKAALVEAASLDDALPEDPFGVSAWAAKAKAAAAEDGGGGGGGGGGNSFGLDQTHEDTAVGGSGPLRTASLDMSSLAKALSPTRSTSRSGGENGDDDADEGDGSIRLADVAAAAAGLARMYGSLGAGSEENAALFGGMAAER